MAGSRRRVVITGVGPVTPIGSGQRRFWRNALSGRSGIRGIEWLPYGIEPERLSSRVMAAIPEREFSQRAASQGRHVQMGEFASRLALQNAGLGDVTGCRTAVVVGTAVGGTTEMEGAYFDVNRGQARPDLPDHISFHTLAHRIGSRYGAEGPVLTVSTGCTAGVDAISMAYELIRVGDADTAICGGADAPLTPVVFAAFDVIGALSRRNNEPERASRPFDKDRDGFVLGEGAAMVVLEEWDQAASRGARMYAEVRGYSSLSNTYHMTDLPPDGFALAECLRQALDDAGVRPADVDCISAHASSTPQNDLCETNAVKRALGGRSREVAVNGLKSMTGHALGASNAIEIAACASSLYDQWLHPTINIDEAGPGCDLDYVANHARPARLRTMVKLSSGFSGIHSALVLGTVH